MGRILDLAERCHCCGEAFIRHRRWTVGVQVFRRCTKPGCKCLDFSGERGGRFSWDYRQKSAQEALDRKGNK